MSLCISGQGSAAYKCKIPPILHTKPCNDRFIAYQHLYNYFCSTKDVLLMKVNIQKYGSMTSQNTIYPSKHYLISALARSLKGTYDVVTSVHDVYMCPIFNSGYYSLELLFIVWKTRISVGI